MAQGNDEKAVMYVNSETGFVSHRIVKGVDRLIYISDTEREKRHRKTFLSNNLHSDLSMDTH